MMAKSVWSYGNDIQSEWLGAMKAHAVALISLAVCAAAPLHAQNADSGSGLVLNAGVVVDPSRQQAYLMNPSGGIVAVNLETGAELWQSAAGAKPLALRGRLLITQAEPNGSDHALGIAALDVTKAGTATFTQSVQLPANVRVSLGQEVTSKFEARAIPLDQSVAIDWRAKVLSTQREVRPPLHGHHAVEDVPTPPGRPAGSRADSGATTVGSGEFELDLQSGKLVTVHRDGAETATELLNQNELLTPYSDTAGYKSIDGRYVVISQRIASDDAWDKYRWNIFDRGNNQLVGQISSHVRLAPYYVSGNVLIYQQAPTRRLGSGAAVSEPNQILAIDIHTGLRAWHHDVRDVVYRGPLPP